MNKSALIIAPHPDDEINLAGQAIIELNKNNTEIFVLYTTNGDANVKLGNKRLYQALESLRIVSIPFNHVYFLGYANDWSEKRHIYNAYDTKVCTSASKKVETSSIVEHPEYCYQKSYKHNAFTRANFKKDFKAVIQEIMPDLIICVDFDSHPDHRATSLFFL